MGVPCLRGVVGSPQRPVRRLVFPGIEDVLCSSVVRGIATFQIGAVRQNPVNILYQQHDSDNSNTVGGGNLAPARAL